MPPLVTVIGDALLDVRAAPATAIVPGGDVPAAISLRPGGQGANLAVRLARRGCDVRLVTAIGEDAAGRLVCDALEAEGVTLCPLPAGDGPAAVVVVVDPDGERTMLSQRLPLLASMTPGAPSLEGVSATDAVMAAIDGADGLAVSGYVLLEPDAGLSFSGRTPRRLVAGCSLSPAQAGEWLSRLRSLAPHLVVLNADEAATLAGGAADRAGLARGLASRLGSIVVVTHPGGAVAGVDGADAPIEVDAPEGPPTVDTTGAGDAFAAALLAELLTGEWPPSPDRLRDAMREASALATAITGVVGAQARVPEEPPA